MQANWEQVFGVRPDPSTEGTVQEHPASEKFLSWEDGLTFAIILVLFLSVVGSIDSARWVDGMPSLYPIALLALTTGLVLARSRWPEVLAHAAALLVGGAVSLVALLLVVPGDSPAARLDDIVTRMHAWFAAVFGGGISADDLPFIVLVVVLTWLAAYLSAWAIFRWHNAWLGLVPGGLALLTNISYLPNQFSLAFVFFLFGAVLLVARMHLLDSMRRWRREGVPYPDFLSLSTIGMTVWAALLLLGAAWLVPQSNEFEGLTGLWERVSEPISDRFSGLSRVFAGIDSKKPVNVHRFEGTLPFQGPISLSRSPVMEVRSEVPGYLRGQVYEVYTPTGWKTADRDKEQVAAGAVGGEEEIARIEARSRRLVPLEIVAGSARNTLFSLGDPIAADVEAERELAGTPEDVAALRPKSRLSQGERYVVLSALSEASVQGLRSAGTDYPIWVVERYLPLPDDVPFRVKGLALDLTRSAGNPFDKARAIEDYLRSYPNDFDVPVTPVGRDTVDYFLFDLRRGYFDYHASAMAVMLRTIGIPARVAVGYVLEEKDREAGANTYFVTERSAFAWPEAYFPGLGWVPFNPTPTHPLLQRPGEERRAGDDGERPGMYAGIEDLLPGFGDLGGDLPQEIEELPPPAEGGGSPVLLGTLLGLGSLFALGLLGARWAWQRGLSGLDEAGRVWVKTVRLAKWARLGPHPHQTPREFVRLLAHDLPGEREIGFLGEAYARSRFGRCQPTVDEQVRLGKLWKRLRRRLFGLILARRLPFLRRSGG